MFKFTKSVVFLLMSLGSGPALYAADAISTYLKRANVDPRESQVCVVSPTKVDSSDPGSKTYSATVRVSGKHYGTNANNVTLLPAFNDQLTPRETSLALVEPIPGVLKITNMLQGSFGGNPPPAVGQDYSYDLALEVHVSTNRKFPWMHVVRVNRLVACFLELDLDNDEFYVSDRKTVFSETLPYDEQQVLPPTLSVFVEEVMKGLATSDVTSQRIEAALTNLKARAKEEFLHNPFKGQGIPGEISDRLSLELSTFLSRITSWDPASNVRDTERDPIKDAAHISKWRTQVAEIALRNLVAGDMWGARATSVLASRRRMFALAERIKQIIFERDANDNFHDHPSADVFLTALSVLENGADLDGKSTNSDLDLTSAELINLRNLFMSCTSSRHCGAAKN